MFDSLKLFLLVANFIITSAQTLHSGVVVTNGPKCAEIGTSILNKNGTAVEAAIAALFCEGVSVPNCMGLGGGFLMNIYIRKERKNDFLVSREVAPKNATQDMYGSNETSATSGGLAVAVPGELKGYWEAYQKYGGKVPWKDLVQPTIDLCNQGIPVTKYLEKVFLSQINVIKNDSLLRETFFNENTSSTYVENDVIKRPRLAKTLEMIAELGAKALYDGNLTAEFVKDIQDKGGIITSEDLQDYKPLWTDPIKMYLPSKQVLYSPPLPGSGVVLSFIMNILSGFLDHSDPSSVTNWQRVVESFKFGYGRRTELGDSQFVDMVEIESLFTSEIYAKSIREKIWDNKTSQNPGDYGANVTQPDDHGTANVCVLAPNGDAVAVTSTINLDFGAGFMSPSTGIILNDQMDDFSSPNFTNSYGVPPSPSNFIVPGKRPMSSMSPSIVLDENDDVRLVVGGSGGTKIITSVALTMIKNLWFNYSIAEAVADKRIHHQLFPMEVQLEYDFPNDTNLVSKLREIGHSVTILESSEGFNTITSISREKGNLWGAFDPRRGGAVAYVDTTKSKSRASQVFYSSMLSILLLAEVCVCILAK